MTVCVITVCRAEYTVQVQVNTVRQAEYTVRQAEYTVQDLGKLSVAIS